MTETTPTSTAPRSVPRNDRATTRLVATGNTMSAATSKTPTTRMAATIVTAVKLRASVQRSPTGNPATRADSSSSTIANSARPGDQKRHHDHQAEDHDDAHVGDVTVRIDPKRYGSTFTLVPAGALLASTTASAMPP